MTYDVFQQGPAVYLPMLLISLLLTMFLYGAFPVIFAKIRKKTISNKKYKLLCYGVNFVLMFTFGIANEGTYSAMPYILWTGVFSRIGLNTLESREVLEGCFTADDYDDFDDDISTENIISAKNNEKSSLFEEQTIDDAEVTDSTLHHSKQKQSLIDRFFGFEKDIPICNFDEYAFADRETIIAAQHEYATTMKSHIIKKAKTKLIVSFLIIALIISGTVGYICYKNGYDNGYDKGFSDNQVYAQDESPVVVITKSGSKYHRNNCSYVDTGIAISRDNAEERGFTPCSRCKPHKIK